MHLGIMVLFLWLCMVRKFWNRKYSNNLTWLIYLYLSVIYQWIIIKFVFWGNLLIKIKYIFFQNIYLKNKWNSIYLVFCLVSLNAFDIIYLVWRVSISIYVFKNKIKVQTCFIIIKIWLTLFSFEFLKIYRKIIFK